MTTDPNARAFAGEHGTRRAIALLVCFLVIVLDGFNTTSISFVVPRLAHDWHLVPALFTPVFVATNVGAALGFVVAGPLVKRFGQRTAGIASVIVFGEFTVVTVFASNVAVLSALRLIAAIGLGAALPIAITASAAIIGPRHKVAASLLVTTGMSVGAVAGGVTGGPLMAHFGWQSIFLAGGLLPFAVVFPFYRILTAGTAQGETAAAEPAHGHGRAGTLKALFDNGLAAYTCLLWLFSFLIFMDVYALLFWVPTLLPSFGFAPERASAGMAAFSMGGLSGNILMTAAVTAMALAGRVRVKSALMLGIVLVIASIAALGRATLDEAAVLLTIGVIGAGLVNGIMGQTALAVAFYPPETRAIGVGWGLAMGRVGSFVGPAIGGALLSLGWPARDIVLTAIVPAVAAMLTLGALAIAGRGAGHFPATEALARH
ncbi:MFS transporter [Paraburkholderia acidipaludis]|uniref:MFS transporter n=1 Tax=Paraburkholderia acidipaludis TaxID=660537 RepID=UPI0005B8923B|nr:MFS transporter [Paraburkholderia acidipaludis]